ncbi:MAG: transcription elongation factor GreA [Chloroflexi bacterium]|nr:transcription elongation factor GreA [Chloroflexota bacterium]
MPKEPVYLTAQGKSELEKELEELLTVGRPAIAATILAAREDGDLKENGAYHDAKDRQGVMEGRIRLLKQKLENAVVIETPAGGDSVELGSLVTVTGPGGEEERYTIVGSMEAKVGAGRISNESPLGKALMGCKVGDQAVVKAPSGEMTFTIRAIEVAP